MKNMKTIWYKNFAGQWVKSTLPTNAKNLSKVQKSVALNGQAEIFTA